MNEVRTRIYVGPTGARYQLYITKTGYAIMQRKWDKKTDKYNYITTNLSKKQFLKWVKWLDEHGFKMYTEAQVKNMDEQAPPAQTRLTNDLAPEVKEDTRPLTYAEVHSAQYSRDNLKTYPAAYLKPQQLPLNYQKLYGSIKPAFVKNTRYKLQTRFKKPKKLVLPCTKEQFKMLFIYAAAYKECKFTYTQPTMTQATQMLEPWLNGTLTPRNEDYYEAEELLIAYQNKYPDATSKML